MINVSRRRGLYVLVRHHKFRKIMRNEEAVFEPLLFS